MRLLTPNGVLITVSESKGERLMSQGFREPVSEKAPAPAPAVKRTRRTTTK